MTQPFKLHPFRPRLISSLHGYTRADFLRDLSAGLTVGIVALPLAMAFAIASGVKPEQGIFTAIVAGFIISAFGGSNIQIGGPAGAFIVIVYGIVARYGLTNLLIATVLAGGVLFLMGLFKLGALVRYVPVSIVIGFTNGIAVLIGFSQVKDLLGLTIAKLPADFFAQLQSFWIHIQTFNPFAFTIGCLAFGGLLLWPRLFGVASPLPPHLLEGRSVRIAARIPGPIVALVTLTVATAWLKLPIETIGTRFGGIPQALPSLELPPFSWASAKELLIPTMTIAMLGAIESLLCARIADNLTELPRHDPNQELMAQGLANMIAPFFGGIPATGTIARTVTNVRAGARTPVAGIVHALSLLVIVMVAAPLAAQVPLAALAGILLYVAFNMGEWRQFVLLRRQPAPYRLKLLGTFVLTVVFDLTIAVQVGLVLACLFFIRGMSRLFRVEPMAVAEAPPEVQVFKLYGALFFGAIAKVEDLSDEVREGTQLVVLEMHRLISIDTSGVDALRHLHAALKRRGIALALCDLNDDPKAAVSSSGFGDSLGDGRVAADVPAALANWAKRAVA